MKKQVFNLSFITGQYAKDDKMHNRYHTIGNLFYDTEQKRFSASLDSLPTSRHIMAFNTDEESDILFENQILQARVVTGQYAKEDQLLNRYHTVGTLFVKEDGKINLKLDSLPFPNDKGKVYIYFFDNQNKESKKTVESNDFQEVDKDNTVTSYV